MNRYLGVVSMPAMATCALLASVASADAAPPAYHEAMIKAGGQADAVSVVCGKVTQARANAHKAELAKSFAAKGVAPARFETLYSGGYNNVMAGAKANPAQVKQACDRLSKGQVPPG